MKNISTLLMSVLVCVSSAFSQSMITSVTYNKVVQPALMLELPYDENVSEGFIIANLKKTGYNAETKGKLFWKQNKLDGYYIFKDVRLKGASQPVDLYFKVERKGKKSKDESVIYMLTSTGGEQFVSDGSDPTTYGAARNFMDGFIDQSAQYKLNLDIKEQEDVVKDAEKKLDKLQDNGKDIVKRIEQLEKDLKKNKDDQDDQQKKVEEERRKLEKLKYQKN
jgi:hypothetical protein